MKILTTFSGRYGDILWSLPTVRAICKSLIPFSANVDLYPEMHFGIMPQYRSLLPLLNAQPCIDKAFVIENWECSGSPCGDQPWEAPVPKEFCPNCDHGVINSKLCETCSGAGYITSEYDKVYHLTYRTHPTKDQPLIDFIASQQGIVLKDPIPFISVPSFIADTPEKLDKLAVIDYIRFHPTIAYAFNDSMIDLKEKQIQFFKDSLEPFGLKFKDVSKLPWLEAAYIINASICFIGCRSANYVLACGLGKRVFVYEPNIARSKYGLWGTTFTCPYASETEFLQVENHTIVEEIKSLVAGVTK
jgi:hypothetical protein